MKNMRKKAIAGKETRLYNMLFPLWMIMLFPITWLIILPGNFLIDSLVLLISMLALKIEAKGKFYKKHILPIFAFGMLSDIVGAGFMLLMVFAFKAGGPYCDSPTITVPALLIAAALIFVLNYFVTFRKLEGVERWKLALIFAVVTAPYTFMVPSSWLYW